MPYGDGTGPLGEGPMTGRGMGPCGRSSGRWNGRGFGARRFGQGFGFRRFWPVRSSRKEVLEEELRALEEEKKAIERELDALD